MEELIKKLRSMHIPLKEKREIEIMLQEAKAKGMEEAKKIFN